MILRMFQGLRLAGATMLISAAAAAHSASPPREPVTAFVNVNVVPMDREHVLHDQTVLVEGQTIAAIGPSLPVPPDARIIDGGGSAFLTPGLADMHIHSDTRDDMAVYLANGITTVLTMGGTRTGFVDNIVPAANRGDLASPHIYTSFMVDGSTRFNGFVIKSPDEARAIVRLAKTNKYDFVKAYVDLTPPVFEALADEARKQALPLVGHGVPSVRIERQLALGQSLIAHSEEFFYSHFTQPGAEESDTPPDAARISEAVALAKRHGATVTADLATYRAIESQIGRREHIAESLDSPEAAVLSPNDRLAWMRSSYPDKTAKLADKYRFLQKLVKAMADGGVSLIAGTDAPAVPTMLPGYSFHENLRELESAGLSRYQALSISTREAGAFIRRTKGGVPFGTVSVGSRADLVLSRHNPLDTLDTLRAPAGVMVKGRWHDAAALRRMLDEVRTSYDGASRCRSAARAP